MAASNSKDAVRPGFLFLVCPDAQLLRAEVERTVAAHPAPQGAYKRFCYWGDEQPNAAFWENLSMTGLFGDQRLVLVRQAHLWPAAVWHLLDKSLSRPLASTLPVFCLECAWEKGKAKIPAWLAKLRCFSFAEKKGWVWRSEGLTDRNIASYIASEAKLRGLVFMPEALSRFTEAVPRHAETVANELDKLQFMTAGRQKITPEMLTTADWAPDANNFSCVERILQGNAQAAWKEFSKITDAEAAVFSLLGILAMTLRKLWQSAAGENVLFFGPSARQMPALARKLGSLGLSRALSCVMEAELSIKSGERSPSQALEFLIASLLPIFQAQGR